MKYLYVAGNPSYNKTEVNKMYSILSLGLGLLAWGFGVAAILKKGKPWLIFSSFTACGLSLTIQFFEIRCQVYDGDWSWFLDVMPTLANVAAVLLIVTVALNAAALWRGKGH